MTYGVLVAPKRCPICLTIGVYDPRELKAPAGWIHLAYRGWDGHVCSTVCEAEQIRRQESWVTRMEKSREEPLLPPDVIIQ
jgi:hypothetical protein